MNISDYSTCEITKKNYLQFIDVFYSNKAYYQLTNGQDATEEECLQTIAYCPKGFDKHSVFCKGILQSGKAVAVLAYLEGYPDKSILWLGLLLVHADFHGQGVGSAIVDAFIASATGRFQAIRLSVEKSNVAAIKLWRKVGFSVIDQSPEMLQMERRLEEQP